MIPFLSHQIAPVSNSFISVARFPVIPFLVTLIPCGDLPFGPRYPFVDMVLFATSMIPCGLMNKIFYSLVNSFIALLNSAISSIHCGFDDLHIYDSLQSTLEAVNETVRLSSVYDIP